MVLTVAVLYYGYGGTGVHVVSHDGPSSGRSQVFVPQHQTHTTARERTLLGIVLRNQVHSGEDATAPLVETARPPNR